MHMPEIMRIAVNTINGERFTGLNFHVFHGFQEYRESFSMNIGQALYDGAV